MAQPRHAGGMLLPPNPPSRVNITQKTFIQRDYTQGTQVRFAEKFPVELEGKVSAQEFLRTVSEVNCIFADAESLGCRTYMEGCLGCMTAYLVFLCIQSNYEKCINRLHEYLEQQNRDFYNRQGLHIISPLERGLRVIEVLILDSR